MDPPQFGATRSFITRVTIYIRGGIDYFLRIW